MSALAEAPPRDETDLREVVLACRSLAGIFEIGPGGELLAFRRPCPDRRCCPRREGLVAVHRWPYLGGDAGFGPLETRYEQRRSAVELMAQGA